MKLLQVDSSARASSVTRRLTAKFTEEWRKNHPDGEVIQRDLSAIALPLITDDWLATRLEESKLTPAQRSYLSTSDELIEGLQAADTVVIGAPMYNLSIPSLLKAWIDQIVRLGKTVGHGPNGPRGLLPRKKVVVITSRGSTYEKGTARGALDFQEPYLFHILAVIGLTDVTFIHPECDFPSLANLVVVVAPLCLSFKPPCAQILEYSRLRGNEIARSDTKASGTVNFRDYRQLPRDG